MIKFKEIVLESLNKSFLLREAVTSPPNNSTKEFIAFHGFYHNPNTMQKMEKMFELIQNKFNVSKDSADDFVTMCNFLANNMTKANPGLFVNNGYHEFFPIADFLCHAGEVGRGTTGSSLGGIKFDKSGITQSEIEGCCEAITTQVTNSLGSNALFNYDPISQTLKRDYVAIKKNVGKLNGIGKIVLGNFKNKSLQETLYYLLELRRQSRMLKVNPEKNPPKPSIDVNGFIFNIYQKGMEKSNPNLKNYSQIDVNVLFEISQEFFDLFRIEAHRHLTGGAGSPDEDYLKKLDGGIQAIKGPDPIYKGFLENKPLESGKFIWKSLTSSNATKDVHAKDDGDQPMVGGYTLGNIMKLKEAKTLVELLLSLAKYIEEGDTWGSRIGAGMQSAANLMSGLAITAPGTKL